MYFFNYLSHDMSEVPNKVNRRTGRADLGWFLQRLVQIDRAHGGAGAEMFKLKEELFALVDNLQTSVKRLPWVIGPEQGGQDGRPLLYEPGAFKTNEMMLLTFIIIFIKIDNKNLCIDNFHRDCD